jgi:hypothetical protein
MIGPDVAWIEFTAADLPCAASYGGGRWYVEVAAVSFATSRDLACAIRDATGGIVSDQDVRDLADRIEREMDDRPAERRSKSRRASV